MPLVWFLLKTILIDQSVILKGSEAVDYFNKWNWRQLSLICSTTTLLAVEWQRTGCFGFIGKDLSKLQPFIEILMGPLILQMRIMDGSNPIYQSSNNSVMALPFLRGIFFWNFRRWKPYENKELILPFDQTVRIWTVITGWAYVLHVSGDFYPLPEFPSANGTECCGNYIRFIYQTWVDCPMVL